MPYVQCVRLLRSICTIHKPQHKMMSSLKSISDKLSVTQEPDVSKIPCTWGRVCICLTWHHLSTMVAEHVGDTSLENQLSAVARHLTAFVRVDTDWVKCGLTSVPANLLFNQSVSSCWIEPFSTHVLTHITSFTLKMVTPVCTEMLEHLWHVTCLNMNYVIWHNVWNVMSVDCCLSPCHFFFSLYIFISYVNCCFIIPSSNNTCSHSCESCKKV
jgi:hypothetical protein